VCSRLCDFAGIPGAETTPFTDAGHKLPWDEYLDHPLNAESLDPPFRIVENSTDGPSP